MKRPSPQAPDPVAIESSHLAGFRRLAGRVGLVLALWACLGPWLCDGDPRAALLAGVPALWMLAATWLGREARYRRLAMIAVTATAGFLALATVASWFAIDTLPAGPLAYQLGALLAAASVLGAAVPAWARAARARIAAEELRDLYEEL